MNGKKIGKIAVFLILMATLVLHTADLKTGATIDAGKDVQIDYINETMTVKTSQDSVIYFSDVYYPDLSKWEMCEVRDNKAVFDISWIKEHKTVRLYLRGDVQDVITSKDVNWQETFKVTFVGSLLDADVTEIAAWKNAYQNYNKFSIDTGYFIFSIDRDGRDFAYYDLQNIEWRKGDDGTWRNFAELDLKEMNIMGVELQFRVKAVNDTTTTVGARSSSIASWKVLKLASAPQTALNENIMSVSVKNGQEISLDRENWILIPDYNRKLGQEKYLIPMQERAAAVTEIVTSERVAGLSIHKLLGIKGNDAMDYATLAQKYPNQFTFDDAMNPTALVLYVRTAGTAKKAASKITEVWIPLTDATVVPKKDDLSITNTVSTSPKTGVTIVNVSDKKYQVAVITPEQYAQITDRNDVDVTQYYWHSVKGGKTLKLTRAKVPQGSYLMYRIAGEEEQLPSVYLMTDTPVDYTVVPAPSNTPVPTQAVTP